MDWDFVCFSVDVEWAHPDVLEHMVRLFSEHSLTATFFCTHPGISLPLPTHERGIHPNFRHRGDTIRQLVATGELDLATADESTLFDQVVQITRGFCPEAIGSRSHSLFVDCQLFSVLARHGFQYDSSYFLPGQAAIEPVLKEYGILELPIFYMDHHDLIEGVSGFRLDHLELDRPGLKIVDFHPNLVFINAVDESHYLETKSFYHDPDRLRAARFAGRGVGTLFEELLDHVADRNLPTANLGWVNQRWRGRENT